MVVRLFKPDCSYPEIALTPCLPIERMQFFMKLPRNPRPPPSAVPSVLSPEVVLAPA